MMTQGFQRGSKIENAVSGFCSQRQPNDVELFNFSLPFLPEQAFKNDKIKYNKSLQWKKDFILLPKKSTSLMMNPFRKTDPSLISLER